MKKITRIVPVCLSVFFVLLIAFPAWVYWRYQYLFYNKYDGDIPPGIDPMDRAFLGICSCAAGICGACCDSSAYCQPDLG